MEIENGEGIISKINKLRGIKIIDHKLKQKNKFDYVFRVRMWHPRDHISFKSNNPGSDLYNLQEIDDEDIMMWPNHCV